MGTLISNEYVLTTYINLAVAGGPINVILGAEDWLHPETGQIRFPALRRDALIYPQPFDLAVDIALLRLPVQVPFSDRIQPIKLPRWSDVELDYADKYALIAGWGARNIDEEVETLEPLLTVSYSEVQIAPKSECPIDTDEVMCVTEQLSSIFEHGGPVFTNERSGALQLGVMASIGHVNDDGDFYNVYVRLNRNLQWIADNTNVEIEE